MMVTFISQCEKNALRKTRRVLDAFAERIGDNTWQTVITQEGLNTVKKMLRLTASKSTAVSCHWIRSRSRNQFLWVVGNKDKFDERGVVPVNSTRKTITNFENDWHYLPLIKALSALSALFHDWGKASSLFQEKLKTCSRQGDPLRHEWISCLLLHTLIESCAPHDNDTSWLTKLMEGSLDEKSLAIAIRQDRSKPLAGLPPAASLLCWLIVSHHRMPLPIDKENWRDDPASDIFAISSYITRAWGYENKYDDERNYQQRLNACFEFPGGFLDKSSRWLKQVKKWAQRLYDQLPLLEQCMDNGGYRLVLHYSRLCLMLGDHYHSSQKADPNWQDTTGLFANTDRATKKFKQKLDEHLIGVTKHTLHTAHLLPKFEHEPPVAQGIITLKRPSPRKFDWQNKAVDAIRQWRKRGDKSRQGLFAVNMAGTGCGKTFANAKVMRALSTDGDSLRYTLALGLRTLTMQTGDEYRNRIKLDRSEMAVLIGSSAIMELHNQQSTDEKSNRNIGSESLESLLDEDVDYDCDIPEEGLATILERKRARPFLYSPVLACTIDHMMAATESRRGGRYILPALRLMSSDLVIDEVDDFTGSDLVAIGRLIHLAGMLGRKVMISSATIPPDLAEGYFNAYREGWWLYCQGRDAVDTIGCLWIDEFRSEITTIANSRGLAAVELYHARHHGFVNKRVVKLTRQPARRKADIIDCQNIVDDYEFDSEENKQAHYFAVIQQAIISKHQHHHCQDEKTGIRVSFGLVRMANIPPCVAAAKYLMECNWPAAVEVRVMAYHSQQTLLLRHEQERHLDAVLKRKEGPNEQPKAFTNKVIRRHLDNSDAENVLFILVSTPVEEVGRDHDFDWAVVEPSSYRSIIQLAGRVRRHREGKVDAANIALLQYNWRTIRDGNQPGGKYFCRPGYEDKKALATHDLGELVDPEAIADNLNAVPRIQKTKQSNWRNSLAGLEHEVTKDLLTNYTSVGPEQLQGYLAGGWHLTALPQVLNPFRKSEPTTKVFLMYDPDDGRETFFIEKDERGRPIDRENILLIQRQDIAQIDKLWLRRDYKKLLGQYAEQRDCNKQQISLRYGELNFVHRDNQEYLYSDQFGLVKI